MPRGFSRTPKQTRVVNAVLEAADRGETMGLSELHEKLGETGSVQAFRCTITSLENWEILETYRKYGVLFIKPTEKAYRMFR